MQAHPVHRDRIDSASLFPQPESLLCSFRSSVMKSPFKKIRDLAVSKHTRAAEPSSLDEELFEPEDVKQDMENVESMRSQYEVLLTNAYTISGAAYDFSRSVQDMASHMMQTFGQYMDQEIGNVFSMLAKVQFEISQLLDIFASHVSQTIISPTKVMIGEIRQVQIMKEQYDEKRNSFNTLRKDLQLAKPKSGKLDTTDLLTLAKEEFTNQAQVLGFRLQSITQGQSRSLITQAARYHSAQMHLFSKGLTSITAIEPVMKQLALEKIIDRSMSEIGICKDVSSDSMQEEEDVSKFERDSESLMSSPTTELQESARETSEIDMALAKVDISSKSAPLSSSTDVQKETHQSHETSRDDVEQTRISMYALPSPSNTGQGSASSKPVFEKPNGMPDIKKSLFLQESGSDSATGQLLNTSGFHGTAAELGTNYQRRDEKMMNSLNQLTIDVNAHNVPKMNRSYSHSGSLSNRQTPRNKHSSDSFLNFDSYKREQADLLHRSGRVGRVPTFTSPRSQNFALSPVSSPQISELHKLPPPPSLSSPGGSAQLARSGKNIHESPPPRSGPTSPLPPRPPTPDVGGQGLLIPAMRTLEPGLHSDSSVNRQPEISSPPLKPLTIPDTTGTL